MKDEDVMNILCSFILIGIIVLINSIQNTLWGLYWILFSLYMILFFMIGINGNTEDPSKGIGSLFQSIMPIILISLLITWLIQIFKSHEEILINDTYNRKMNMPQLIPDTFYSLYAGAIFMIILKVLIVLKNARDGMLNMKTETAGEMSLMKTLMNLSVYGLSLITFLLIMGMYVTINFYVTDG
jgi:hypothetical protein